MQVARKDKIPKLAYKFRKFFILLKPNQSKYDCK